MVSLKMTPKVFLWPAHSHFCILLSAHNAIIMMLVMVITALPGATAKLPGLPRCQLHTLAPLLQVRAETRKENHVKLLLHLK